MPALPEPVVRLIAALRQLPGVGPRSAERMALQLVQSPAEQSTALAEAIREARQRTRLCSVCGALTETDPCGFCTDDRRDASVLCLVEQAVDILSIEKSGAYRGRFHVLGGKIAPLDGVGPEDLKIAQLEQRLREGGISEVIIALGTDVEGDATSHYLSKRLARPGLRLTRIAHGLPAGAGLEFADELTLSRALEGRREIGGDSP
ncbi:MAG: recombination mediator RecR [Verrucomicrobia bacterium]|jgi:recombination protein RecR|nr:recombination mediator RecR [Verrucomicrobiota bacterium]